MNTKSSLDILKEAILLERRGKEFYSMVANQTKSEAVKKIFSMMAEEEIEHIHFLSEQFIHFEKNGLFKENETPMNNAEEEVAMKVLSENIKTQITAASFEAAAISSAIDFETRAVQVYTERAESATDENEKKLYRMLADWEKTHHFWLHKMNTELKESIWFDNHFWPF